MIAIYYVISAVVSYMAVYATHKNDLFMAAFFLFSAIQTSIIATLFLVERWRDDLS
jgi:hypothetical protein